MNGSSWPRVTVLVATVLTLVTLVGMLHPAWTYLKTDEATYLASGVRMNQGQRIYQDYHEFIPPVMPLIHAAMHKHFGAKLLPIRALALAAWVLAWLTLAWTVRGPTGMSMAAAGTALLGLWLYSYWPVSYHQWWGGVWLVLWVAAEKGLSRQEKPSLPLALTWVLCLVLLPYTSQTLALIGFMGLVGALLFRFFYGPFPAWYRHLFIIACSAHALVLLLLAWTGRLPGMFLDQILWPMWYYRQEGGFNDQGLFHDFRWRLEGGWGAPLPTPVIALVLAVPFLLYAGIFVFSLWDIRRGKKATLWMLPGLLMVPVTFWLGKMDSLHWIFLQPMALAALMVLLGTYAPAFKGRSQCWLALPLLGAVLCLPPMQKWRQGFPREWQDVDRHSIPASILEEARRLQLDNGGYLPILPRSGVFEFYGLHSPLPWSLVLPTEFRYQSSYEYAVCAERLGNLKPKWVILFPFNEGESLLSDKTPLGFELRQHYQTHQQRGNLMILRRKGLPAP